MINYEVQGSVILNDILLKRKSMLFIPYTHPLESRLEDATCLVAALNENIKSLGYTFDESLAVNIVRLFSTLSPTGIKAFEMELVESLKKQVGADVEYKPFYPNFPNEVMVTPELELYINAICHYLTFGEYFPESEKEERPEYISVDGPDKKLRTIRLATQQDYLALIEGIVESRISISIRDKDDFMLAFQNLSLDRAEKLFTKPISNKENLAYLVGTLAMLDFRTLLKRVLKSSVNNGVDVLRIACILSGNESAVLSNATRFKNFKNWERKLLMETLEGCKGAKEDLQRQKHLTKMLAKAIHPVTYKKQYPHAYEVFHAICSDTKVRTFNSKLEALIQTRDLEAILSLVSTRPGEFARRLDQILSLTDSVATQQTILKFFNECAVDVAPKVLMDMLVAFRMRNKRNMRYAAKKGNVAQLMEWCELRKSFSEEILQEIESILTTALKMQFAQKGQLGRVYINPTLDQAIFPTVIRNAGERTRNYARGTRIPFTKDTDVIRSFIYWHSDDDIDLSNVLYGADFEGKGCVNFHNLKRQDIGIIHSGDITDGSDGAAEFIDIEIQKALDAGIRYITMNVNLYSGRASLAWIGKCYAGIMTRKADQTVVGFGDNVPSKTAQNGELYESESVLIKSDVNENSRATIPYVIDLKERCVIITDFNPGACHINSVANQLDEVAQVVKYIVSTEALSIAEVVKLHIDARGGQLVSTPEEADVVFDWEQGITPFDLTTLASEWM